MSGAWRQVLGNQNRLAPELEATFTFTASWADPHNFLTISRYTEVVSWRRADDEMQFPGYYTMDFLKDGKTAGMLSVNGYTGQVWYHTWHGNFIGEKMFQRGQLPTQHVAGDSSTRCHRPSFVCYTGRGVGRCGSWTEARGNSEDDPGGR